VTAVNAVAGCFGICRLTAASVARRLSLESSFLHKGELAEPNRQDQRRHAANPEQYPAKWTGAGHPSGQARIRQRSDQYIAKQGRQRGERTEDVAAQDDRRQTENVTGG